MPLPMSLARIAMLSLCLSTPLSAAELSAGKEKIHLGASRSNPIQVAKAGLFPEGIAFNSKSGKFLVGSFREGAVYEVAANGAASLFVSDPRLNSVLGLCVDTQRNRLLIANSDIGSAQRPSPDGPSKLASLGIYDLTTGRPLNFINLGKVSSGKNHLANDLTLDAQGNAYITDSLSPVIYKVDVDGNASIFLESDRFRAEGVGLNGIIFHPEGFLIVTKKDDGALFKVPLENPGSFSRIKLSGSLRGSDGLVLVGKDNLAVICNKTPNAVSNAVVSVRTSDHWNTATIVEQLSVGDVYPTTGTVKDDKLYIVHSRLNTLISAPRSDQGKLDALATIEQVGTITR
jgi:sugar lactone lactonase YvrE